MAYAIQWDQTGERTYETGTKKGVLYPQNVDGTYGTGVAWNGITGVTESPSGAEATDLWADDIKYLSIRSAEEFGFTLTAYTYPDEFGICDGTAEPVPGMKIFQQSRRSFGLSFVTTIGNDTAYNDYGYKLHLIYGATASPSERGYSTINDSPEAIEFSWECTTIPVSVDGYKNSAEIVLDSTKIPAETMAQIEAILYGEDGGASPRLPLPAEIISILGGQSSNASLSAITIGSSTLAPTFAATTYSYGTTTSNAKDAVSATAASGCTVTIKANGTTITSGDEVTWNAGANTVVFTASKAGANTKTYTVSVVKT